MAPAPLRKQDMRGTLPSEIRITCPVFGNSWQEPGQTLTRDNHMTVSILSDIATRLDDQIRGIPPGTSDLAIADIAGRRWHPADGAMSLPVLTLNLTSFAHNRDTMLRYVREQGVAMAPHGKTPMAPDLAADIVRAGAWGTTVADIRQATVMLRAGLNRLILANGIGGRGGAGRLAALLGAYPAAELYLFVDSAAAVSALAAAWTASPDLAPLRVLVEVGAARGGARDVAAAQDIIAAVTATEGRLRLAGVGTYEGAATQPTPERTETVHAALFSLAAEVLALVRAAVGRGVPLVLTAGGSVFFDRVVAALRPVVRQDGDTTLVLRGGAIFFHDHGVYERGLAALDARGGFVVDGVTVASGAIFRPALRVWAEVLSRPEPGLAVCGLGMRDVASDQDLPRPLTLFRDGAPVRSLAGVAQVSKLNDQHAFLDVAEDIGVRLGDVVEFGLSHPCTSIDHYRFILGVDDAGVVQTAIPTCFG
jgi:D-serine deaminase-like pyridoxal phosphate-dependent protein